MFPSGYRAVRHVARVRRRLLVAAAATGLTGVAMLGALPAAGLPDPGVPADEAADLQSWAEQSQATQARMVRAAVAYEQAEVALAQAQARAQEAADRSRELQEEAESARSQLGAYVASLYARSVAGEPLVQSLVANPHDASALLEATMLLDQTVEVKQWQVTRAFTAMRKAEVAAAQAAAAEVLVADNERRAKRLLAEVQAEAARLAATVEASMASFATSSALHGPEQQARNEASLRQWERYLAQLDRAGVTPPPAARLTDLRDLPDGLNPLLGPNGRPVPGVAAVRRGRTHLTVLSRETVKTVTAAFTEIGKPYVTGQSGPHTFDCGGFVSAMWRRSGVEVDQAPEALVRQHRVVPAPQTQVGDVVLASDDNGDLAHAGLYLGGDLMIAADAGASQVAVVPVAERVTSLRVTLPRPDRPNRPVSASQDVVCGADATATAEVAVSTSGGIEPPLAPGTFTFGHVWGETGSSWPGGRHTGLDLVAPHGTPVLAAAAGIVHVARPAGAGNLVTVTHGDGMRTSYAHLSQVDVRSGETVAVGQRLGAVGAPDQAQGPHLHFEVWLNGRDVDPLPFLTGGSGAGLVGGPVGGPAGWGNMVNGMIPQNLLCSLATAPFHRLRCDAANSFDAMSRAFATSFGQPLCITDSYRSYAAQVDVYARKPTLAAVPGTSNHGWALAVDLCGGVESFNSAEHRWMVANAGLFGWVHPRWAQATGSRPEPWHWEFGHLS